MPSILRKNCMLRATWVVEPKACYRSANRQSWRKSNDFRFCKVSAPPGLDLHVMNPARDYLFLDRDDFSSNRHPALSFCLSMIFSENRFPLFRIML
jgi:hypothetical protein